MEKESQRQKKYARLLQRDLGEIFQREMRGQFGSAFITITEVKVSPDLGIAKVYLSFLQAKAPQRLMDDIADKNKAIRHALAQRIGKQVRVVPVLRFYHDDSAAYADKIEALLAKIDIPPADDNPDESR